MKKKTRPPTGPTIGTILRGVDPVMAQMLRTAHEQGFRVDPTKKHLKVSTPEHWQNQACTHLSRTPSEPRSRHNARAGLRQLGVKFNR